MSGKGKSRKLIPGTNDLATTYPESLQLWDFEKNTIQPCEVTYGSGIWIWCKCSLGHSWKTRVKEIARGRKCPYCTNKKILKGFNDLASKKPELLEFWDFEKNVLSPYEVGIGSARKSWWICSLKHSWYTVIRYVVDGARCPFCSGNEILEGFNDLSTKFPEIVKEWNFSKNKNVKPTEVFAFSSKIVWWKCQKCSYEWKAVIGNRTSLKQGCPPCAHSYTTSKVEKELRMFIKSISTSHLIPNCRQAIKGKELDIYLPDSKIAIEFNGLYWHSEKHKNPNYHYDKWLACKEKDIFLAQVWEDDWRNKSEALKNKLTNMISLFQSNIEYKAINSNNINAVKDFYERYSTRDFSSKNEYLLIVDEKGSIQAVMSYKHTNQICRILDFTTLSPDTSIFSSFIKHIKNLEMFVSVEYFDDNCFSNSLFFKDLEFHIENTTPFSFWSVKKGIRVREIESGNSNNAYKKSSRIFDAGLTKYVFTL